MPITQQRMIALINAGLDYQQALDKSIRHIAERARQVLIGQLTADEAIKDISLFCVDKTWLLHDELIAFTTIATERAHFASNMRRNIAAAKWQEHQRRAQGVRPQAPSAGQQLFLQSPASPAPATAYQSARSPALNNDGNEFRPNNLAWDPSDGDDSISIALFGDDPASRVTGERRRQLEREIELINAPAGHESSFLNNTATADSDGDLIGCLCGFKGGFADWLGHLPAADSSQEGESK